MGLAFHPQPKPARGSALIEREEKRAKEVAHEREIAKQVKKRDGRCRWPEEHKCRGELEAAHLVNKSQMGETSTENEVTVCAWIHRRGPASMHGQQLKVEKETDAGADGPLSFWKQDGGVDALGQPTYYCVARERSAGVVERD